MIKLINGAVMVHYLIKNGYVLDGSSVIPSVTNIGIQGDRIVYIGNGGINAGEVIDARGLVVTPGFIDTHAHSDFAIIADGRAEGKLSQGITTEINGNCGASAAPLLGESLEAREMTFKEFDIGERWSTFREYFDILERKGTAVNFATLCGHGNIRASVIGWSTNEPNEHSLSEMKALLTETIRDGAKGLSTGLVYPPGVYSQTEELIELSRILAVEGKDKVYTTHVRSEGNNLLDSLQEVAGIGREAQVKVHISHIKTEGKRNWGKIDKVIGLMEDERDRGIKLTCDRYPYVAASTDLDYILPPWVYEGGVKEALRRLKDSEMAKKIKSEIGERDDYWDTVQVSSVSKSGNKWMEGLSISRIAKKLGKREVDALIDILADERLRVGAIIFSMCEENLRQFISLPYTMVGSDSSARCFSGLTHTGKPHPRGFGAFPRFIGKYVRDQHLLDISEAIKKITHLPAVTFALEKRGLLREGFYADLVVFDYDRIIDRATFRDPFQKSEGILYVFVNGRLAVKEGELTGGLYGRILR